MTKRPDTLERPVMRSSVTPSLKYSWVGSPLRFVKGSTATGGREGNGRRGRRGAQPPPAAPPAGAEETRDDDGRDDPGGERSEASRSRRWRGRRAGLEAEAIHAHRPGDVLDGVLAEEV